MSAKHSDASARAVMIKAHLKPQEPYRSIHSPWKCICTKCKRVVTPTYTQVRTRGNGCKYCGNNFVDPDEAFALMLSKGLRPKEKYKGAGAAWKCECLSCGETVRPSYSNVRTGHGGCRFCAHKITVLKKTKTKAQIFKYLRSKGYEPIRGAVFKSSRNPIECKHLPCGRIVKARYFSIQQGRGCCNHCGTQAGALKWANTKSDVLPLLKKKKIILLDKNLKGMRQKHRVKCKKCDLVWSTRLSSLTSQIGCPGCADYGLKPHLKSYIYLVHNRKLTAWKIGIANSNKGRDRVEKHLENGWTLYKKKIVKTGTRARYIESECLRFLRIERKLTIHLSQKQMPQGGWTETVDSKKIRGSTIWAKVEELSKVKR